MDNRVPILKLYEMGSREIIPGTKVRFVHSENMTFAHWIFEADVLLPEHSHPHEQVTNIIDGVFDLTLEGKNYRLEAGTVAIIPSNALHSGKSITKCHIIDVFYPIREDYR